MREPLKQKIWYWFVEKIAKVKEGEMYPLYLRVLYFFVFPLRWLRWKLNEKEGYQPYRDLWIIGGQEYSGAFFRFLNYKENKLFRIKKVNDYITIEEVKEN